MMALTKITKTEIFALIAAPIFKLWSRKVLFINRTEKNIETVKIETNF